MSVTNSLIRPHWWTNFEDKIIKKLFPIMSTEKLSVLMKISTKLIIERAKYLEEKSAKTR